MLFGRILQVEKPLNQLVLKNCLVLKNSELVLANIGISNGLITEISGTEVWGKKIVQCRENFLMPGIIDCHVHFRSPGHEYKEDWVHASFAAAAGGITTVLDMPNTLPPTTSQITLLNKRKIAQNLSLVNFGFHFGATGENTGEIENAKNIGSIKIYTSESTQGQVVSSEQSIKKIFETAKKNNLVVCVHAEDQKTIEKNKAELAHSTEPLIHSKISSAEAEATAIELVLNMQKIVKNKLHICHLSSKDGVKLVGKAKEEQQNISCEVTPHHLFLTEQDTKKLRNFAKVNPSIKGEKDRLALWKALKDGTIDCVASDHAPHTIEEKKLG
ncbi:MAG: dihydroorotase family protein, partial [Candidatus Diapherotrites archaeon]|nr:dihydroorotase family protein [Candidatus Diapherotrites archaeon]